MSGYADGYVYERHNIEGKKRHFIPLLYSSSRKMTGNEGTDRWGITCDPRPDMNHRNWGLWLFVKMTFEKVSEFWIIYRAVNSFHKDCFFGRK